MAEIHIKEEPNTDGTTRKVLVLPTLRLDGGHSIGSPYYDIELDGYGPKSNITNTSGISRIQVPVDEWMAMRSGRNNKDKDDG